MKLKVFLVAWLSWLATAACAAPAPAPVAVAPVYGFEVVRRLPHDRTAFTQGLLFLDGHLYESTGLHGRSSIRKVELETGRVVQQRAVPPEYFGEGIVAWKDRLLGLTWQSEVGFIFDLATFEPEGSFGYEGEGWGLTHDGRRLIMSDGTPELRFLDPDTLAETGRVTVTDQGRPIANLNELEFVRGEVYANIWQSDRIARIDPVSGKVTGWIDLKGLMPFEEQMRSGADVLNGIAYDAATDRLFVTGKLWPALYEIKVTPRPN